MSKDNKVGEGADDKKPKEPKTPEVALETKVDNLTKGVESLTTGLNSLVDAIKSEREERQILETQVKFIADRSRQQIWDDKQKDGKDSKKKYRLSTFEGKVVVGWTSMKQNVIYQQENKMWVERLTTELIFEDDSRKEVDYKKWQTEQIMIDVLYDGEELASDGTRILKLVAQDGKKFKLDIKFCN